MRDGAMEFVKDLAADGQQGPVMLFSHVPLYRAAPEGWALRERGTLHRDVGHGWQKKLGKKTSQFLLESLRPAAVFRDYCDVARALPTADGHTIAIHEVTVKSYSPARHIMHAGLHLLALSADGAHRTRPYSSIAARLRLATTSPRCCAAPSPSRLGPVGRTHSRTYPLGTMRAS
ncbi:hypothetical protein BC834DRAFT_1044361 [Gloeopeniophorella convolvens]|nr:hypothetical protein BC834DRAFT_1044361 [Gloeopeniophorella convolvens]